MTAKPFILSAHSDEALNAEIAFWCASANFELKAAERAQLLAACANSAARALIFELKDQDDSALDLLSQISLTTKAKIIALTSLDQKTISSFRRLFQVKSLNVIIQDRAEFTTRLLADLLRNDSKTDSLDRETLSQALADGHVIAHYQPKVPFQLGLERYGVEALCRIQHPTLGLLFPDSFIPLAEAHGLILELTDAVTAHAFKSLQEWDRQGLQLRLAINISPSLLNDSVWFDRFQLRCQEYEIDAARITLEVTESSSHGGKALALEILSRLRLKGFLLSIDDFGTGFSSLETLYKLPFGELKIDKGFVFDIQKTPEARTLIESTVSLAKKLGLKVCAEGVESEAVFEALRDLKCDDAQGYHISKPLPANRVVPFLEEWRSKRRALRQSPISKFANVHALVAELLAGDDDDDHTVVLTGSGTLTSCGESASDLAARIPSTVMSGDMLQALELTHRAAAMCAGDEGGNLQPLLVRLQDELESGLCPGASAELAIGDRVIKLLGGDSFVIGRQSANAKADIAIPCRWLSRGEKNLRLFSQKGRWLLEDLGSTNGHFMAANRLVANQPVQLDSGVTRIEVGRMADGSAPAWLTFSINAEGAALIEFGVMGSPSGTDEISWIALSGSASIGGSVDAVITQAACGAEVTADISWSNSSLWVTPRAGETIRLSGVEFAQRVPLMLETSLEVGNAIWPIRALTVTKPEALPTAAIA